LRHFPQMAGGNVTVALAGDSCVVVSEVAL
jgi:hypothetical protein